MALTYDNVYAEFIVEPLVQLMTSEFQGVPVRYDDHIGNSSFLVTDLPEELVDLRTRGQLRQYQILVVYDYQGGDTLDRKTRKELSNKAERFRRLIDNFRDFVVLTTWVLESGTWGNTTHTWNSTENTYCWHTGSVEDVDYEQEEDVNPGHYQVKMIFQCFREEVVA